MTRQLVPTHGVPTGGVLQAISDQTIFKVTAAQLAGMTGMNEGWHAYVTDVGPGLLKRYDGSRWISYPLGIIDHDSVNGAVMGPFTSSLSVVSGSGVTAQAVTDEWYAYELQMVATSNTNGDTLNVQVQKDEGSGYADWDVLRSFPMPVASFGYGVGLRAVWHSTVTGTVSWRAKVAMIAGTGNLINGTDCTLNHDGGYSLS